MSKHHHRPFGPLLVALGLGVYTIAWLGGGSFVAPGRSYMCVVGAGTALAGLWIAGLDRLFPAADFKETLAGGILTLLGILPLMGALPAPDPASTPAERLAMFLVGLPLVTGGLAWTGLLAPLGRTLETRGVSFGWLLGGATLASWAFAGSALAVLLAERGGGPPIVVAAASAIALAAGGAALRLAFSNTQAQREVVPPAAPSDEPGPVQSIAPRRDA